MTPDPRDESEWRTRKTRIDGRLRALGWQVVPHAAQFDPAAATRHAVEEYPTANGPADYALFVGGRVLGIVEAKKVSLGPQNVLVQARRYAEGVADSPFRFGAVRVPFLLSSNGEVVWFRDARDPLAKSRRVADYPTPGALEELLGRDLPAAARGLLALPNDHHRLRAYQREANAAVERAVAERARKMLLVMATGCGKTFTTVNQVYRLMKAGAARRVLFLVDRRALAAQAVRAFAAFEPEPGLKFDAIYEVFSQRFRRDDLEDDGDAKPFDPTVLPPGHLLAPAAGHAFVYVCTVQRMAINLLGRAAAFPEGDDERDDEADRLDIPVHAFDLVVADECHRGYTAGELSTWRRVLDHFDAVKIGLTATPSAQTVSYFESVVYRYEYEQAVRENYLVDYDAVAIRSDVRMTGLFLKEGEQVEVMDTSTGLARIDTVEDERAFDTADIERKVTAPDANRKVVEELKKYALAHEAEYGRFPKTLVFAANDLPHASHADQLVTLCREAFGRGDSFVQKITGSPTVDRPLKRIREFRNRPAPGVVVTVDMLSTGVDIPDLEFIVLLRPVKSRTLFTQMLGRGTRKGEKYPDKSHFTVFDCFDGTLIEYFRGATGFTREERSAATRPVADLIGDIWSNKDRKYNVGCLVKRLNRIDAELSGDARAEFAALGVPDGDLAAFAAGLPDAIAGKFTETMKLLRDEAFQKLLVDYPRPPRGFLVAHEAQDSVTSRHLIRDAAGRERTPADYLELFAGYVRDNPDRVAALSILAARPRDWGTAALGELKAKLAAAPHRFTEDNLRKAHAAFYQKPDADLISMVQHARDAAAPLLSAAERVDRALAAVFAGAAPAPDALPWVERIRAHLTANLSIDRDDFADMPVLAREGGWVKADRAFGGKLADVLARLNEAVAA